MTKRNNTSLNRHVRQLSVVAGLLCAGSLHAGTAVFDFNTDPSAGGLLTTYGNAWWSPSGGVGSATNSNDGYLVITDAANSQSSTVVFADIDAGQVVKAFTFEADFRIGNGSGTPADGFSVNYVRANDPVLESVRNNGSPTGDIWARGQHCEANLPEEGTRTGIAIGFDAYDSGSPAGGAPFCDVADQSIGPDVAALTVRVDGTLVAQFPMPVRNGECTDARSLQTGPLDENNPNSPDSLCWAHLKVELKEDGKLNVWWKGTQLLTDFQTAFFPSPGALVFAGRTGGLNQNQQVDNIKITTIPASLALVGTATGHPLGFSVIVNDSGNSVVDTAKPVTLKLNNATVTATSVEKVGGVTTVTYRGTTPLTLGATNTVEITVRDVNNNAISGTPTFVTPAYLTLPAAYKVASVDTAKPGFTIQPYQTTAGNPNRLWWTDLQLLGLQGPNLGSVNSTNFNGVLDFSNTANPGSNGQFPNDLTWDVFGLPTTDPETANISIAATAYAHFPQAGLYTFGGNSDDGIRLTFAKNAQDLLGLEVPGMTADLGRGIAPNQNTGYVWIPEPGYYGFRLLWENGGGGADLEFYTKSTPSGGTNTLVNSTEAGALKVYQTSTTAPAFVSFANPPLMHDAFGPGEDLTFRITDAATTVQPSGVTVKVDGNSITPVTSKSGNVTTVVVPTPLNGWTAGNHTINLDVATGTATNSYSYVVRVNANLVVLDPSVAAPLGSQVASQPGFTMKLLQTDRTGTSVTPESLYWAEQVLAGYWGNSTSTAVSNFAVPGVINFDIGSTDKPGNFDEDNGYPEEIFPGIPGTGAYGTERFAAEFKTWLEFKTNGVYQLNFNSDDGFIVSLGHNAPAQIGQLEITSPSSVARGFPTVWSTDAGINLVSNAAPISGKLVLMRGADTLGCAAPSNAAELAGNIALVERGGCTYSTKARFALEAGAKALVVVQNRPEVTPEEGWFPVAAGVDATIGRLPIPVVMISRDAYLNLTNTLATTAVNATLNPYVPAGSPIWRFDAGKGHSDVNQYVRVTQPGLYPIRIAYYQGGGGGNAEFEQNFPNGTRALINDTTNPASIRAYRAVSFTRPTIGIARDGNSVRINYTGTLQSSDTVNGTYTDVAGASSPYTVDTSANMKFFRTR